MPHHSRAKRTKDFVDKVLQWTHVTYAGYKKRLENRSQYVSSCGIGVDGHGDVDAYGFERFPGGRCPEGTDVWRELDGCLRQEEHQRRSWSHVDVTSIVLESEGHEKQVAASKRLCRGGVPPELRKQVWYSLSGASRTQRYYENVLGMTYSLYIERGKTQEQCKKQIDLDVPRTFPHNKWIQSDVGQVSLQRVLYAFSGIHPAIGYCQGMNYVAAMLLLVLEYDEETVFWTLCRLIGHGKSEGILYKDVYASSLSGCHVEMRTLESIVAKKLPNLSQHMSRIECDFSMISTEWFLCLYATCLPPETVARVWDILFCEGPKILYRIAIALLKIHEEELLQAENSGDLLKALHFACAFEFNRDTLLTSAFEDVGQLSMVQINRLREHHQIQVDKEVALRETKEKLRVAIEENGHVLLDDTGEDDLMSSTPSNLDWKKPPKVKKSSALFLRKYFKQSI